MSLWLTLLTLTNVLISCALLTGAQQFPSRAPSGVRVTSVEYTTDLLVKWNPLSQIYTNGKILSYTIYYKESRLWFSPYKTINTGRPYPTQFVLKGLKPAERYHVAVAAFTSKGRGPMSYYTYGTTRCFQTLRPAFGEIKYSSNKYYYTRCHLSIISGGMPDAIAVLSVQEINFRYCSEYVKITGNCTDVFYYNGCKEKFSPEILFDVHFGSHDNISIQVYTSSSSSSIKIEYAILRKSLTSAVVVSGWNISVSNPDSSGATLQWTSLDANVNHQANFYIIEVKSINGIPLGVHTVPGNTTTSVIKRLKPSTKYRVVIYGVDSNGQPYMSSQSVLTTSKVFCGTRPSSTRIVGGTVATINSWPWQVMLIEYGSQFCGGSLVDPYWVITAAHCVEGKSPNNLKIRVGAHYRISGSAGTEQDITVSRIIVHENYQSPKTHSNDIALLNLKKPAILGVGVGLVCLPDVKNNLPVDLNKKCWITGWGDLYSGGYQPNTLRQASVPLVSKQRCSNVYPGKIDNSMLCASLDQGGIDTCQGDSGGPLVCEFQGTWHLEGITSWGDGCAQAYKYGVYAKVRALNSWVRANMYKVVPPSTIPPQNQSSISLGWCSFDNGLCSGWSQSSADDFDWMLGSGWTPSSSTGPSFGQGGSGNYMYIEASSPRKPGEKAQIVVTVPNKGEKACLSFYYHMYGASAGTLNVYNDNDTVFNVSGNQGNRWVMVERSLHLDSEITFEGVRGGSYTGDIAIDQVLITEGNCPVSCSFDDGLCPWWSQSKSDVFDWRLGSGSTPSWGTGPSSDRSGTGYFMYIEAFRQSYGDNAKLILHLNGNGELSCLTFYYHMYGARSGALHVYNENSLLFKATGNHGNYWLKAEKTFYSKKTLTFEGRVGYFYAGTLAIDDVLITRGSCSGETPPPTWYPVPTTLKPSTNPTNSSIVTTVYIQEPSIPATTSCNFDSGLCSGWWQSHSDVFDWRLRSRSTPSPYTGPDYDHTSGYGYYMYIEATWQKDGDNAKLMLNLNGDGELSCLKFYYHMYGVTIRALYVYSENSLLFKATGNHGNYWLKAERTFYSKTTLTFEGTVGYSYTGDIAIDDVSITRGSCPGETPPPTWYPVPITLKPSSNTINSSTVTAVHTHKPSIPATTSCNFDGGLCFGWWQSHSDVFDWRLRSRSTPSSNTGPDYDHTSGYGYYMYIEATWKNYGDNAKLMLNLKGNGELSCLKFYYHMYGATTGSLHVYNENSLLFKATGNHGNHWFKAERTFYSKTTLTFEGIVGYSHTGDIAIDDVSITRGSCSGQTPTTLKPTSNPINSNIVTTAHTHKPSIPDGCSDDPEHASICSTLSIDNELCQINPNWNMKHCRKACGYCTGISTSTHVVTFKQTTIPRTPSAKEMQEAVMLKMTNFDMNQWKEIEADFKRQVASAATRYCAGGRASCQRSLRRRRSSDSMEFSADMVNIVPGYPKQSPGDLSTTLLAFYLQLPGDFGDNLVNEDVLKNIVKSDLKSIEGSIGARITTVQSMPHTQLQYENDKKDNKDDEKSTSTILIVAATLGALLLLTIIISVTLCIKIVFTRATGSRATCHLTDFNETLPVQGVYIKTQNNKPVSV